MITQLFRPVGLYEFEKIMASEFKAFPPRLPEQPIFYPVLNMEYASQIARDWNTVDKLSGYCGFVTSFDMNSHYLEKFKVQQVGAGVHKELWVPADKLEEFNSEIIGKIRIINIFYGEQYEGPKYEEVIL